MSMAWTNFSGLLKNFNLLRYFAAAEIAPATGVQIQLARIKWLLDSLSNGRFYRVKERKIWEDLL